MFSDFKCDLKPPGFRTFLSRCIRCPPAVLAHLCRSRRLDQVPVFDSRCRVQQALDKFNRFYVCDRYYSTRMNR